MRSRHSGRNDIFSQPLYARSPGMVGDKHEICKGLHFANVKAYIEVDSALISGRRRDMPLFGAISCSDAAVACTGILIPAI